MILAFAWTTPAVVLGLKSETRRDWKPITVGRFQRLVGADVAAYDRNPRNGGRPIGTVRIVEVAPGRSTADLTFETFCAEGLHALEELGETLNGRTPLDHWIEWVDAAPREMTVVRFEVLGLNEHGRRLRKDAIRRLREAAQDSSRAARLLEESLRSGRQL